jgi:hypothetical protein
MCVYVRVWVGGGCTALIRREEKGQRGYSHDFARDPQVPIRCPPIASPALAVHMSFDVSGCEEGVLWVVSRIV